MRCALAGLAVLLAGHAAAQEVDLGRWILPEGTVVAVEVTTHGSTKYRDEPYTTETQVNHASTFTVEAVEHERVTEMTWRVQAGAESVQEIWEDRQRTLHDVPYPGIGFPIHVREAAWGWHYTTVPSPPDNLFGFLGSIQELTPELLVPFLDRRVRVGTSWQVPFETQELWSHTLLPDREQHFQVRLDSLGMWESHRAAFLSYESDQVSAYLDGEKRTQARGFLVHRLDIGLTVLQERESTVRLEWESRPRDRAPYPKVGEGTSSYRVTRRLADNQ